MTETPEELKYTKDHEWVRVMTDSCVEVGITDHAQDSLGEMVFVELPEMGARLAAGDECAVVESVKAASDVYAPVSGEIIAVNDALADDPETLNRAPYADGWLFRMRGSDASELDELMDAAAYRAVLEQG
ncbi:MAG: glycine cleavage system protein GcvH [Gammaproteobacteria bacterium]|nr:glycine cleavage system protein GcvH [Gammaproteobacteria bacterium]